MTKSKKQVISEYMSQLGKKGGATKGAAKARPSEQARKAVQARWAKRKAEEEASETPKEGS